MVTLKLTPKNAKSSDEIIAVHVALDILDLIILHLSLCYTIDIWR